MIERNAAELGRCSQAFGRQIDDLTGTASQEAGRLRCEDKRSHQARRVLALELAGSGA